MERLGTCMDELRVLARSNDPDRAVLADPSVVGRYSVRAF